MDNLRALPARRTGLTLAIAAAAKTARATGGVIAEILPTDIDLVAEVFREEVEEGGLLLVLVLLPLHEENREAPAEEEGFGPVVRPHGRVSLPNTRKRKINLLQHLKSRYHPPHLLIQRNSRFTQLLPMTLELKIDHRRDLKLPLYHVIPEIGLPPEMLTQQVQLTLR